MLDAQRLDLTIVSGECARVSPYQKYANRIFILACDFYIAEEYDLYVHSPWMMADSFVVKAGEMA